MVGMDGLSETRGGSLSGWVTPGTKTSGVQSSPASTSPTWGKMSPKNGNPPSSRGSSSTHSRPSGAVLSLSCAHGRIIEPSGWKKPLKLSSPTIPPALSGPLVIHGGLPRPHHSQQAS